MSSVPEPSAALLQRAAAVRRAAVDLGQTDDGQRAQALQAMADALTDRAESILAANREDLERSAAEGLAPALMARLKLDDTKLAAAIDGVRKVASLSDPLGCRQLHRELDQGLVLERVSVPLGVVGVIFEARPDAVMQIASLAIRSGNGALLKGGSEARCTNEAVMEALQAGLAASPVSRRCPGSAHHPSRKPGLVASGWPRGSDHPQGKQRTGALHPGQHPHSGAGPCRWGLPSLCG